MAGIMVRSRSVSISVPSPPPPSPHFQDTQPKSTVVVTVADVEELLRLLCAKTNTTLPATEIFFTAPAPSVPDALVSLPASALTASASSLSAAASSLNAAASSLAASAAHLKSLTAAVSSSPAGRTSRKPARLPATAPDANEDTGLTVPGTGWTAGDSRDTKSGPASASPSPSLGPLSTDAGDESLQRYKESLGLSGGQDLSDPNDPRVCIIKSLTMETPGRDPVTIDLSVPGTEATLKDHPFTIKEGSLFTMVATFKVQHEVLNGLRYVQIVKRKGVRVSKDSEMIGSYAPNTDKQPLYTKRFQEDEAPSGMLARGHYVAQSSFVDDDKKTHLAFEWSFDIAKDW